MKHLFGEREFLKGDTIEISAGGVYKIDLNPYGGSEPMIKTKAIWLSALCVFGSFGGGLVLITALTVWLGWWALAVALGIPLLISAWYALYGDFRRMS